MLGLFWCNRYLPANTNMAESFVASKWDCVEVWTKDCDQIRWVTQACMLAVCRHIEHKIAWSKHICVVAFVCPRSLRGTTDQRAVAPAGPASPEPPVSTGRASRGRWSRCSLTHTPAPTPAAGSSLWTSRNTCRCRCSCRQTATAPPFTSRSTATRKLHWPHITRVTRRRTRSRRCSSAFASSICWFRWLLFKSKKGTFWWGSASVIYSLNKNSISMLKSSKWAAANYLAEVQTQTWVSLHTDVAFNIFNQLKL